jgi:hypothetical protein
LAADRTGAGGAKRHHVLPAGFRGAGHHAHPRDSQLKWTG